MPHTVQDATEALYMPPNGSKHSAEGLTFPKMAARRLPNVDSHTIVIRVTGMRSAHTVTPPLSFFLKIFAPDLVPRALS